jgi:saccharopine dehydrogenase-like NADP-dependent oxidoreductase
MKDVLLVGGGKIGAMITELLANSGAYGGGGNDYRVTVADRSEDALRRVVRHERVETLALDVADEEALARALAGKFAVLSAAPFSVTLAIAKGAAKAGVHYFDLTEDVATTHKVLELAKTSTTVMMPQCGLAPGFISILGMHVAGPFDELEELRLRVGALTQFPTNGLKYNLTWSTAGLIHEYLQGCEAVVDGKLRIVEPLEGLETFSLDGIDYEAFNTSGGLGTLCERLEGVRQLNYKTVRYPGHNAILKLLIQDLKLGSDEKLLVRIFDDALPVSYDDVVLIFVSAIGRIDGQLRQKSAVRKVYARALNGQHWSGIQITTASAICAVLDLVREGRLPQAGFIHHDQVDFDQFIGNRFGKHYS